MLTDCVVLSLHRSKPMSHLRCAGAGRLAKRRAALELCPLNRPEGFRGSTSPARVSEKPSCLGISSLKRADVQPKRWLLGPVNVRSLEPGGMTSSQQNCCDGNHTTLCLFFNRQKTHGMLGEIPAGEIPNNESNFPAHPTIFKTKDKLCCS